MIVDCGPHERGVWIEESGTKKCLSTPDVVQALSWLPILDIIKSPIHRNFLLKFLDIGEMVPEPLGNGGIQVAGIGYNLREDLTPAEILDAATEFQKQSGFTLRREGESEDTLRPYGFDRTYIKTPNGIVELAFFAGGYTSEQMETTAHAYAQGNVGPVVMHHLWSPHEAAEHLAPTVQHMEPILASLGILKPPQK